MKQVLLFFAFLLIFVFAGCDSDEGSSNPANVIPNEVYETVTVTNNSTFGANISIDNSIIGFVPGGSKKSFQGDWGGGNHEFYAKSSTGFTWWGPFTITIPEDGEYSCTLNP